MDVLKKPFNQTKVGKLLNNVLPDKGIIGVLKDVLDLDDTLTPEDKEKAAEMLLKAYEAEVSDRDSARKREVEVTKTGKIDFLFNLTGLVGLTAFGIIVWAILALDIPESNKELFYHLIGIVEGVTLSIFGYYFGNVNEKRMKYQLSIGLYPGLLFGSRSYDFNHSTMYVLYVPFIQSYAGDLRR
jgi:hypothetical protein